MKLPWSSSFKWERIPNLCSSQCGIIMRQHGTAGSELLLQEQMSCTFLPIIQFEHPPRYAKPKQQNMPFRRQSISSRFSMICMWACRCLFGTKKRSDMKVQEPLCLWCTFASIQHVLLHGRGQIRLDVVHELQTRFDAWRSSSAAYLLSEDVRSASLHKGGPNTDQKWPSLRCFPVSSQWAC